MKCSNLNADNNDGTFFVFHYLFCIKYASKSLSSAVLNVEKGEIKLLQSIWKVSSNRVWKGEIEKFVRHLLW